MGSSQLPTWSKVMLICTGLSFLSLLTLSYLFPERLQLIINTHLPQVSMLIPEAPRDMTKWTPYMDFLEEKEALKEPRLLDIRTTVNQKLSKIFLIGNRTRFHLGEEIRIGITLVDGYGRTRTKGGDQLRVRIHDDVKGAYATGYVVDHRNGTYTAFTRALWTGSQTISVTSTYPREVASAWYYTLNNMSATRIYFAHYILTFYKNNAITVQGICHPFLDRVSRDPRTFCNRTEQNGGMSLFCYKPDVVRCKDFVTFSWHYMVKPDTFNDAEWTFLRSDSQRYKTSNVLKVSVEGSSSLYTDHVRLTECPQYDARKLWTMPSPVGFFYNNTWRTVHCLPPSQAYIDKCVVNKHITFIGDSTTRQWFEYIQETYKCPLLTHRDRFAYRSCYSKQYNLFAEMMFHSIPGHFYPKETVRSITGTIDTFNFTVDHILVIHMQCHVSAYHPRVFRDRMTKVRHAIDRALTKNKNVKIYLKGPGTFLDQGQFGDYFGYVYRGMLLDIFKGIFDKVVYLDSKDMTISTGQFDFHPDTRVVKGMVNQLLSYACH